MPRSLLRLRHPHRIRYSLTAPLGAAVYLIELKYLKRSERFQRGEPVDEPGVAAAVGEGTAQLERYLADERLARQFPGVRFIGLIVVFHGWEMVFCDAVRR